MEEYNAYVGLDVHKDTVAVAVAYAGSKKRNLAALSLTAKGR